MIASWTLLRMIPTWAYGALLLVALGVGIEYHGRAHVQHEWDADRAEIARIAGLARAAATARNEQITKQQVADNKRITKGYADEIAKIRADIARAPGLRPGPGLCAGFAAATQTAGAIGSNDTDSGRRLVRPDVGRDLDALKLRVEEALAAGRTCQDFIRSNGMAP